MNPPKHVAIIMDGNGRWGLKKKKSRNYGHKKGLSTVEKIITAAIKKKIKHLTLFVFSTENWKRPINEINYLFKLLSNYIDSEIVFLIKLYNLIINIARGDLNPFDFFFYDRFRKYKHLIDTHRIELPLTKKEFDELYQNTPDYIGSLLNYYCPKKKYPRQIISNKNYHCDINFETVA